MSKKRVAVIGAGPSGLCALRHLANDLDKFAPVAFEKNREVGGLWNYSDCTDIDEYGLPCFASLYKDLRINLPKEVMCFPDQCHAEPSNSTSFVHHSDIKRYLDCYAENKDLKRFIEFQTIIMNVKPCVSPDNTTWLVTTRHLANDVVTTATFDAVIVCAGKENKPHVPTYPGMERFKGSVVHIKNHRDNEVYRGKTVLLVGASCSGKDVIFSIGKIVKKMYVVRNDPEPLPFELPENIREVANIREVLSNGVLLEDTTCYEVDAFIFATGYEFDYPFLAPECGINIKDERIQPLYNHLVHIEHPSLFFIGILKSVLHFQVSYVLAQYTCAVIRGDVILPAKSEMYRQEEEDFQKRVVAKGKPFKIAHDLFGPPMREYIEKLERETRYSAITKGVLKFFDRYCYVIVHDYGTIKQRTYRLIGDDDFEEIV